MERKWKFPGVGWLSSRLSVKLIIAVVLLALASWGVLCAMFASYLGQYAERIYGPTDPILQAAVTRSAYWGLLLVNVCVFVVGAILIFFVVIAPIVRLRKAMQEYYRSGKAPERTVRADEIGRLQNTFADLTAAAERKDQAERRLIASISHDIKTPLTSVLGYSERLRSAELSDERREQYTALIHEKALRLKAVVDEFDDYLDVGLHNSDHPMTLMTAGELCDRLHSEYGEELEDAGVRFQVQCYAPKAQLICNWQQMRRLFGNLISNSINHANAPRLELTVQCRQEGDRLLLGFRDNGVGVPEELLGQIFEPLFTSDKGRKVSGLGLSICQSIIKAHGGSIHAENATGGGLLIEAALPCVEWEGGQNGFERKKS